LSGVFDAETNMKLTVRLAALALGLTPPSVALAEDHYTDPYILAHRWAGGS
jgi:hypothetical protein